MFDHLLGKMNAIMRYIFSNIMEKNTFEPIRNVSSPTINGRDTLITKVFDI